MPPRPLDAGRAVPALLGADHLVQGAGRGRQRAVLHPVRRLHAVARTPGTTCFVDIDQHARPLSQLGRRGAGEHRARRPDRLACRLCAGPHPLPGQARRDRDLRHPAHRAVIVAVADLRRRLAGRRRGRARALLLALVTLAPALQARASATTTSSSGSSPTASCRRSSPCCRSM